MKFIKLQLLVIAFVMFAASSAFAALSYNVSVDTSSLNGQTGYLYFTYIPANGADSSAMVSSYSGGSLAALRASEIDGTSVTGLLPGSVVFANTGGLNDYNQGITFGSSISFLVSFVDPAPGGVNGGSSTFSLGLYQDEAGLTSLLGGALFAIDLMNDGSTSATILDSAASVTPTPIPAAAWLLGSGLMGLVGLRRRKQ